jgi:hypothetical protein
MQGWGCRLRISQGATLHVAATEREAQGVLLAPSRIAGEDAVRVTRMMSDQHLDTSGPTPRRRGSLA